MEIAAGAVEEQAPDARENGIAEIPVQRRHRARHDAAAKTVAHHEIVAFPQFRDESSSFEKS